MPTSPAYDPHAFPPFAVTVDLVILTVRPPELQVLLLRRAEDPFAGEWALPGGFVGQDQDLLDAARFKLGDKTGISLKAAHLEQLGSFGAPDRDPRMRVVSVAYLALVADPPSPEAGTDAEEVDWVDVTTSAKAGRLKLAFDHTDILAVGLERARAKLEYTTLATSFCQREFTMAELRGVYETVWGQVLDPANFHRKVLGSDGFVVPTGKSVSEGRGRPAKTYRAGKATSLSPPIQRHG